MNNDINGNSFKQASVGELGSWQGALGELVKEQELSSSWQKEPELKSCKKLGSWGVPKVKSFNKINFCGKVPPKDTHKSSRTKKWSNSL